MSRLGVEGLADFARLFDVFDRLLGGRGRSLGEDVQQARHGVEQGLVLDGFFEGDDENVFFHNGPIEKPVAESYRLTIYPSSDMIPRVRAERLP